MSKFKIGDKVKIAEVIDITNYKYKKVGWDDEMEFSLGKAGKIVYITERGYYEVGVNESLFGYFWREEDLTLIESSENA